MVTVSAGRYGTAYGRELEVVLRLLGSYSTSIMTYARRTAFLPTEGVRA